jgi:hypothetical protein
VNVVDFARGETTQFLGVNGVPVIDPSTGQPYPFVGSDRPPLGPYPFSGWLTTVKDFGSYLEGNGLFFDLQNANSEVNYRSWDILRRGENAIGSPEDNELTSWTDRLYEIKKTIWLLSLGWPINSPIDCD